MFAPRNLETSPGVGGVRKSELNIGKELRLNRHSSSLQTRSRRPPGGKGGAGTRTKDGDRRGAGVASPTNPTDVPPFPRHAARPQFHLWFTSGSARCLSFSRMVSLSTPSNHSSLATPLSTHLPFPGTSSTLPLPAKSPVVAHFDDTPSPTAHLHLL